MATLTACPRCRTVVPPGHPRCLRCGHAVDEPVRVCAACEHRNDAQARFCARCGHPAADPVAAPAAPVQPADTTGILLDRGSRRSGLVVAASVLLALCLAVAGLEVVGHEFFSPAHTVSAYFEALAARDADRARSLLVPGETGPLLRGPALRSGGYAPPAAVRVEHTDVADGRATVRVSFALAGARRTGEVDLRRDDRATAGLFHDWHIEGGVYQLDLAASGVPAVDVAGTPIPLGEDAEAAGTVAFPGTYQVSLPDQPLWTAAPVTARVGPGDSGAPVTLQPTIKDTARSAIDQQVRAYVDGCARSTELSPPNCPFQASPYDSVRNVHWKIKSYPEVELDRDYGGRLVVSTTKQGDAEVTGTATPYFGGAGYAYDNDVPFTVGGTVLLSGSEITFQPSGS